MLMMEYKVVFENNKPVKADALPGTSYSDMIQCSQKGGKRLINWLVVFGYDEKDAIHNAEEMVDEYLGTPLGLSE